MIPERIFVEGFLCYRDAQEACFDGCSLWLLAGTNGSGKSALFDAVTYSLYGQHRAGRNHARGLINKASRGLVVEFDFRLDSGRYRARRTLARKGRPTRQLSELRDPADDGNWSPIPDTHTERGFSHWVEDHLGLSYETFTASVVLLQGRAENLLQVGPAERHDLLSQIVGLEHFRQLHQHARRHCMQAQGGLAMLRDQLKALPRTSARQLKRARTRVSTAVRRSEEHTVASQQLGIWASGAEQWQQLQTRERQLEQQIDELSRSLQDEARIQSCYDRWILLSTHVDKLSTFEQAHDDLAKCEQELETIEASRQGLQRRAVEAERLLERSALSLYEAEQELQAASLLDSELGNRRVIVAAAIPACERLHHACRQLFRAETALGACQRQLADAQRLHDRVKAECPSKAERDIAGRRLQEATERKTRREVMAQEAEQRSIRLTSVSGANLCDYCQQPLPQRHLQSAHSRLQSELDEARSQLARAIEELHAARAAAPGVGEEDERIVEARAAENRVTELKARLRALQDARQEAERCVREALAGCPKSYRTQYQAKPCEAPEEATRRWATELETLTDEQRQLVVRMHDTQERLQRAQASIKRLREERGRDAKQQQELTSQLQSLVELIAERRADCAHLRRTSAAARGALLTHFPAATTSQEQAQVQALRLEYDALEAADIPARYRKLQDAQLNVSHLSGQLSSIREQIARIPESARKSAAELGENRARIEERQRTLDRERQAATADWARLEEAVRQREALTADLKQTDRDQYLWDRLAILLGRTGLLRYLVRHAERAIVDLANEILDRLSAGQLFLELRTDELDLKSSGAPKALDLLARMASSDGELQEVAFLSGSQKFRVAVSLSLAVGQYATQARRPVQAVIIDEGFGCLDTVNRQVMIQELHNLRDYLKRVLIVSHQEEFAAAFPDGYRSEMVDGTTRLTRFHQ